MSRLFATTNPAQKLCERLNELKLSELDGRLGGVEAAVDETYGIDHWCSGPDWVLAANRAFAPTSTPYVLESKAGSGFGLFAKYENVEGKILAGLEPMWGFACPLIGADLSSLVAETVEHISNTDDDSKFVLISGLPTDSVGTNNVRTETVGNKNGRDFATDDTNRWSLEILQSLAQLGDVQIREGIVRQVATIGDGYEQWFERRSRKFRRNLRRAETQLDESTIEIVDVSNEPNLFERIAAIELKSWKRDEGILGEGMSTMYELIIDRLKKTNRLTAFVAIDTDKTGIERDVGYILGGVRGRTYRGLQLSFDQNYAALSLGNMLQLWQIKTLTANDTADVYDLGMDYPYKQQWADQAISSLQAVIERK